MNQLHALPFAFNITCTINPWEKLTSPGRFLDVIHPLKLKTKKRKGISLEADAEACHVPKEKEEISHCLKIKGHRPFLVAKCCFSHPQRMDLFATC